MATAFDVIMNLRFAQEAGGAVQKKYNDIQKQFDKPFELKFNTTKGSPIGRITSDLSQLEKSLEASNARVIAFGTTVGVIASVQNAFRSLVVDVAKAEQAFTNIQIILQATQKDFQSFQKGIFNVAKETGNSFKDVSQTALEFSRQGLTLTETLDRTRAAMLLTKIAGSDLETSVQAITSALTTFTGQGLKAIDVVSKFSAVDTSFAVSSDDLAEALFRVGNSAEEAGVSLDQLNAIVAATRQTTGRTGPVIGNGLKTIFTRVQRSDTLDQLEKLGVSVRNLEGDSIGAVGILQNLANAFDSFSQAQQKAVAEVVAGGYQINTFLGLLKSVKTGGLFEQAFDISANANPEQLIQRVNEQTSTLIGTFNKLTTSVIEFSSLLGEAGITDFLKGIVGGATSAVELLKGLFENESGEEIGASLAKGVLGGFSNFFSGPGLVLLAKVISSSFASVGGSLGGAAKNFLGLGQEQRNIELVLKNINKETLEQISKETSLHGKVLLVNKALQDRLLLEKEISSLATNLTGNLPKKEINKVRSLASGYLPLDLAFLKEQSAINKGVGGASGGAKPRLENLNIEGKRGKVVVNSDEKIIRNFLGSGEDAVLTKEMLKGFADGFIPNFNIGFGPNIDKDMIPMFLGLIKNSGLQGKVAGTLLGHGSSALAFDVGKDVLKTPYKPTRAFINTLPEEEKPFASLYGTLNPGLEVSKFSQAKKFLNDFPFGFPFDIVPPQQVNIGGIQGLRQKKVDGDDLFDIIKSVSKKSRFNQEFGELKTAAILVKGAEESFKGVNNLFGSLGGPEFDFNLPNLMFNKGNSAKLHDLLGDIVLKKDKSRLFDLYGQIHTGGIRGSIIDLASGHIPNLFTDQIYAAFSREIGALMSVGYSKQEAIKSLKLDKSHGLRNAGNPMGFGVYNTLQERNLTDARVKHNGHIPSFASPSDIEKYLRRSESHLKNIQSAQVVLSLQEKKANTILEKQTNLNKSINDEISDLRSSITNFQGDALETRSNTLITQGKINNLEAGRAARQKTYDHELNKSINSIHRWSSIIDQNKEELKTLNKEVRGFFSGRNTPTQSGEFFNPSRKGQSPIELNPKNIGLLKENRDLLVSSKTALVASAIEKGDHDAAFALDDPNNSINRKLLENQRAIDRVSKFDRDSQNLNINSASPGNIFRSFFISSDREVKNLLKKNKGVVLDKDDRDNLVNSLSAQKGQLRLQSAIGASIVAPLLASTASSAIFNEESIRNNPENLDRKALLESFGTNLGLGASGFSFGPLVGAATTLFASYNFLNDIIKKNGESFEQLKLKTDKLIEANRSFVSSLEQFESTDKAFNSLLERPETTSSQLFTARQQKDAVIGEVFSKTTTDKQRQLLETILNSAISEQEKIQAKFDFQQETRRQEAESSLESLIKKNLKNDGGFLGIGSTGKKFEEKGLKDITDTLGGTIKTENITKDFIDDLSESLKKGFSSSLLLDQLSSVASVGFIRTLEISEEQKSIIAKKLSGQIFNIFSGLELSDINQSEAQAGTNVNKSFSNLLNVIESRRLLQGTKEDQTFKNALNSINNNLNENRDFFTPQSTVNLQRDKEEAVIQRKLFNDVSDTIFNNFPKFDSFQGNKDQKKLIVDAFREFSAGNQTENGVIELRTTLSQILGTEEGTKSILENNEQTLLKIGTEIAKKQEETKGEIQRLNATASSELKLLAQGARKSLGDPLKRDIFKESDLIGKGIDANISLNNPFEQRKLAKELKDINTSSDFATKNRFNDPTGASNILSKNIFRRGQLNKTELERLTARNTGIEASLQSNLLPSADLFADGVVPRGLKEAQNKARGEFSSNQARISELQQGELLQKSFEQTFDTLSREFRGTEIVKAIERDRFAIVDFLQRGEQEKAVDLLGKIQSSLGSQFRTFPANFNSTDLDGNISDINSSLINASTSIQSLINLVGVSSTIETKGAFRTKAEEDAKRLFPVTGAQSKELEDLNDQKEKGLSNPIKLAEESFEQNIGKLDGSIKRLSEVFDRQVKISAIESKLVPLRSDLADRENKERNLNLLRETIVSPERLAKSGSEFNDVVNRLKEKAGAPSFINKEDLLKIINEKSNFSGLGVGSIDLERFLNTIKSDISSSSLPINAKEASSVNSEFQTKGLKEQIRLLETNIDRVSNLLPEIKSLSELTPAKPISEKEATQSKELLEQVKKIGSQINQAIGKPLPQESSSVNVSSNTNVSVDGVFGNLGALIKETLNDLLKQHVEGSFRRFVADNKDKKLNFSPLPA